MIALCITICFLIYVESRDTQSCPSNVSSKVSRDLENLSFIRSVDDIIEIDTSDEQYSLNEMASILNVDISACEKSNIAENSNIAAKILVESLVDGGKIKDKDKFSVICEPTFKFNGISSDIFPALYNTPNNRGDVAVYVEGTNLVNVEVNSSPMSQTVTKVIHGLVELLRIVKAHNINEDIKLKLIGFALPKLNTTGLAVKVEVSYKPIYMAFEALFIVLKDLSDFPDLLFNAIEHNSNILQACKKSSIKKASKTYIVTLNDRELSAFGESPKQCASKYAVLCEAKNECGIIECFKKPKLSTSCLQLADITQPCSYRVHYKRHDRVKKMVKYTKVKYDPLTYKEAKECLRDLIRKVVDVSLQLNKEGIQHKDLRLPNICFDENFKLILIDLDRSVCISFLEAEEKNQYELKKFAEDLIKNLKDEDLRIRLRCDKFILKLCDGIFDEELLRSSLVTMSQKSVRDVISQRTAAASI